MPEHQFKKLVSECVPSVKDTNKKLYLVCKKKKKKLRNPSKQNQNKLI